MINPVKQTNRPNVHKRDDDWSEDEKKNIPALTWKTKQIERKEEKKNVQKTKLKKRKKVRNMKTKNKILLRARTHIWNHFHRSEREKEKETR